MQSNADVSTNKCGTVGTTPAKRAKLFSASRELCVYVHLLEWCLPKRGGGGGAGGRDEKMEKLKTAAKNRGGYKHKSKKTLEHSLGESQSDMKTQVGAPEGCAVD